MRHICFWMDAHGLKLAVAKTGIVLLTKRRIDTVRPMQVGDVTVQIKAAVKYLRVMLDTKLTFWEQIRRTVDKAMAVTASMSRTMANIGGPRPCMRRLLMRTTEAILLYGAEVWADALQHEKYRKRLAAVQRRRALLVACSYCTVSEPAIMVVAGVIPTNFLVKERRFVHQQKAAVGLTCAKDTASANTMRVWQDPWTRESRGRWTARLRRLTSLSGLPFARRKITRRR
ncbi:PREDICTED: uncharacterized protein LOC107192801 [Dufourea novaeangliae]|uniref:uncharacterized protein LOC107192801 n=1 Tax=Dufourea novaeangliae TaxID=178035 RepID=UPI0007671170|nr:PREDICTED: uncharacterized protein LOC107192801 [Dufourea novaeangliae]